TDAVGDLRVGGQRRETMSVVGAGWAGTRWTRNPFDEGNASLERRKRGLLNVGLGAIFGGPPASVNKETEIWEPVLDPLLGTCGTCVVPDLPRCVWLGPWPCGVEGAPSHCLK